MFFWYPYDSREEFLYPNDQEEKVYSARKNRNRAAIKLRQSDNAEFCKEENESRLERYNKDHEDSYFLAKYNKNQFRDITKRLKEPEKRGEHEELM